MTVVSPSYREAVQAIEEALLGGVDPEAEPMRSSVDLPTGQLLLMPASGQPYSGVKIVTIAAPGVGTAAARIQGTYLLIDTATLRTLVSMDGAALTRLRTAAVSAVAIRHLAEPDARHLLVFGTGPQAWAHVVAARAVRPIRQVTVVGRDPGRADALVVRCRAAGLTAARGSAAQVAEADLVVCCTTARAPLFDGALPGPHTTVVAIGSHEPDAREVDEVLVRRSTVVVEARAAAGREAGDLLIPGAMEAVSGNLAELVQGRITVAPDRPRLFKSVGMAWEDLVVARLAYEKSRPPADRRASS